MTDPLDLIIVNARIATGNPRKPWATALALRANTLAALGQAAEIVKMARPTTTVVDAHGVELVLPPNTVVGEPLTVSVTDDGVRIDAHG